jgi:alpha-galactosidase
LYYAFYAPSHNGPLQLRGLESGKYRVTDYVNNRELGIVSGPVATLNTRFDNSLLIEVRPAP